MTRTYDPSEKSAGTQNGDQPVVSNPRTARMMADLEEFLKMPDPLGAEGWEELRQHIREHGLRLGRTNE
jgi:hypothetical protein